jgi:hypothetical protein
MRKLDTTLFYRCLLVCLVLSIFWAQEVHAQTPTYFKGTGTGSNTIPMNTAGSHTQQIYTPADFNTLPISGLITKIFFRNAVAGASGTYTNFSVAFLQNSLTAFPNSTFLTGFTTALSQASITINGNATALGWYEIPLSTPFLYNNGQTLIVEIKYDSRTGGMSGPTSTASGSKRLSIITAPGAATGNLSTIWGDFGMDVIPAGPCTSPPTPGTAIANPALPVCTGTSVTLNLTGHSQGSGQTYIWQKSATSGGTYTDISTSAANSDFIITPTSTAFYRCAVTCSGNTQYSTPVEVVVNPALPGGTYTVGPGGNYQTLAEVSSALSCGIAGPVVFSFMPGTGPYTEQIAIPQIGGVSATNTIVFDGNGVTLQASPVTATRHIIKLDGADYITIRDFNILAQAGATFGWGVHLTNGADNNRVDSCTIDMSAVTSTTQSNSAGIVISGSTTSVTTAGSGSNNTFNYNTIIGAYQGIIISGTATSLNAVNNKITRNTIRDFYANGITLTNCDGAEVAYNDINRATRVAVTTFAGIELGANNKNCIVNANRIHDTHNLATTQSGTSYGIYSNACDAPVAAENKVINNLVYNINSATGTIYGIYNSGSDGTRYYHNTIVLDFGMSTAGTANGIMQATAATNIEVKNNIVFITRAGSGAKSCLAFTTVGSAIISNKNVLFMNATAGTNSIGTYGTNGFTSLIDWQGANSSAYDQQSTSVDPLFVNPVGGDFTPAAVSINDIGDNVGVATDILGAARNITNPDPGAYELTIAGCTNPPTPGVATASVTNACTSQNFTLDLMSNSVGAGQTYQWQSAPSSSGPWTNLGSPATNPAYTTSQAATSYYRCAVKCGSGTVVYSTSVQVITPSLVQGEFTINSTLNTGGTNFKTFGEAVDAIRCGISGPVVFKVSNGPYDEQVVIPSIYGTSATNTITFKGNLSTLSFNSTNSNERAGITLNGADHIIIDSLIIEGASGTYGWGVLFINKADSNTISNCIINTSGTATTINHSGIVFSSSFSAGSTGDNGNYNTISGNTITGGYYGIYLVGNSTAGAQNLGNIVRKNKIRDSYTHAINVTYQSGALISGNEVTRPTRTASTTVGGVFLSTSSINCLIEKNIVHNMFDMATTSTSTCYGIYVGTDGAAGQENKVINNLIYNIGGNGTAYGIYNTGGAYMQAYYNTISLDDAIATSGVATGIYQTTASVGIDIKNNIVVVSRSGTGAKRCIHFVTTTSAITSNNNVLFMSATQGTNNHVGQFGTTNYTTLTDWKTANTNAYDQLSLDFDPLFIDPSIGDYRPRSNFIDNKATPITGITTDITGAPRDAVTPDPGAYEFATVTAGLNMGAEALVTPDVVGSGCYSSTETVTVRVRNSSVAAINFAATPVTVTVNVTGAVTQTLTKILNTGTLAGNTTLNVMMPTTLDMTTAGVYTFNANTSVTGDVSTINDAMPPVNRTRIALSAGTLVSFPAGYCIVGGIPNIGTSGATGYSGLQWQQSVTSGTGFADVPTQTGISYTPATAISQTMYYRLVASCGTTSVTSAQVEVAVSNPLVLSTTPGERCGPGTVALAATTTAGSTLNWYDVPTGGTALGTGTSFTTPSISNNTTYYVSASGGNTLERYRVGYVNTAGYSFLTQTVGWGAMFTAHTNCTLDSVYVYPTGTGTISIKILDPSNNVLFTGPTVNISGTGTEKVGVHVGAGLIPGNYKMGMSSTGVTNLGSQPTGTTMAYPFVSVPLTITSGSQGTGAVAAVYYWFYDWVISTGSSCVSNRLPVVATIKPAPSATISYSGTPFCNASGTVNVSHTGTTGGTYSSTPGLAINSTTGAIDLTASSFGNYTVTYTVPAAGVCAQYQATTIVDVTASPAATISYASGPYCNSGGTANVTQNGSMGGVYSSTTGLTINAATGAIDLNNSTPGTYTVSYNIAASGPCPAFSTTTNITINAAPTATIAYPGAPFCTGAGTATAVQTGATGGVYSGGSGLSINASTGEIALGTSTPGTYTVKYTIPPANGCIAFETTATVTISAASSATISYPASPYCSNAGTINVTRTGTTGGVYSSTAGLVIDAATGAINAGASTAGTYTVTYSITASGNCQAFTTTASITITPAPSAAISYAGSPYCSNAGIATVTHTGMAGGVYSSTTGLSINGTTGTINLGASIPGTYTVAYTLPAAEPCAQYQTTTSITITPALSATISYAGSPFCGNTSTANVTQTGTSGGVYSSTAGLTIDATTGMISPATSTTGTYTVRYTIPAAGGCQEFLATATVIITPPPSATISYAGSPYCTNSGTATVTQTGTSGGAYSSTTGLSINSTTGAISLGTSTPGTYTVTYTVAAANGCATYLATANVTVSPAAAATISYPGSPYCVSGGTASVTRAGTSGGTYTSTAGLSINATTGAINLGATTPGTYTITYTVAAINGCGQFQATASVTITGGGTWLGTTSSDWNNGSNWCGGIPTSAMDVTIPATAPNMPNLSNGSGAARNISIGNGANLTVGTAGALSLYGNITGGGAFNASAGSLLFRAVTVQTVPAFTATNVTMNGAGGMIPGGNVNITGTLTLTNGNITLGNNNLALSNSSTGLMVSHIITNGTGQVTMTNLAASQTRTVPVGSDAVSYNPVTFAANAGHTTDNITVRVQQGVYENGTSGTTFNSHVADRMWIINEAVAGGSNVNLIFQWNGSQELTTFDRTRSYVMQHNGTEWVAGTLSPAGGTDPYTQFKTNVTSFSAFAVETQRIPRPVTGVYPNPTTDYLNVVTDLLSTGPVEFKIYDTKGRLVHLRKETMNVGLNLTQLDVRNLAAGTYILRVTTRLNRDFLVQMFIKGN